MRHCWATKLALVPLSLASAAAAQTISRDEPLLEIPRHFWGEYNEDLAACGTGSNESRLRISWDTVQFYESVGELQEMIRLSDNSMIIVANHISEGERFTKTYQLQLSPNGQILKVRSTQDLDTNATEFDRFRCPA